MQGDQSPDHRFRREEADAGPSCPRSEPGCPHGRERRGVRLPRAGGQRRPGGHDDSGGVDREFDACGLWGVLSCPCRSLDVAERCPDRGRNGQFGQPAAGGDPVGGCGGLRGRRIVPEGGGRPRQTRHLAEAGSVRSSPEESGDISPARDLVVDLGKCTGGLRRESGPVREGQQRRLRRETGEEIGSGRRPSQAGRRTDFGKRGDRKPRGEHPGSEQMKGNRGSDHRQPLRAVPLFRIGFHGDGEPGAVPSRISVRPASRARSPSSVRRPWRTRRSASR